MSHNANALLLAGSLILASGVGVIYLNTERTAATKQATVASERSMTKRAAVRASVSVYGLPAQITPISMSERMLPAKAPSSQGFSDTATGTSMNGSAGAGDTDTMLIAGSNNNKMIHRIGAGASWYDN